MGVIVYGVSSGEYSDYRVAAIFATEQQAQAWIRERKKYVSCSTCNGTGKLATGDDGKPETCWDCEGKKKTVRDRYKEYFVEKFSYNPTGEED